MEVRVLLCLINICASTRPVLSDTYKYDKESKGPTGVSFERILKKKKGTSQG